MTTVTLNQAGSVELPEEILKESHIAPGSQLVVLAHEGKNVLLDRERFRERVEKPAQEMLAEFRRSLARDPQAPFFDGLTLEEYAALSDEDEQSLWDRLPTEAEAKVKGVERNIPAHFHPAGQRRR
jgi:bifunctional DNA-binding transcriptional regulator/antitoxin component of YhaV-PrlF toxin-antitoxin module